MLQRLPLAAVGPMLMRRRGALRPTLALNFLAQAVQGAFGTLDSRVNFSRGSLATVTRSDGLVGWAGHNLLPNNRLFSAATWSLLAGVTATSTGGADPVSTLTATAISGDFRGVRRQNAGLATNTPYTLFADVRPGTGWAILRFWDAGSQQCAWFSLATGAVGTKTSGVIASTETRPNGDYRLAIRRTVGATISSNEVDLCFSQADGSNTAASSQSMQVRRMGLSVGSQLMEIDNPTSSAYHAPRFQFDPSTATPLGLLVEEQRTNLLTWSEAFESAAWGKLNSTVTASAGVAPDGTPNARLLTATTTAEEVYVSTLSKTATAAAYTLSVYVKRDVTTEPFLIVLSDNVSGEAVGTFNLATQTATAANGTWSAASAVMTFAGNGWFRCSLTATSPANTGLLPGFRWASSAGQTVLLWGAQLEAGAFATTYIPTFGATATRAADLPTLPPANIPGGLGSAGTLVAGFTTAAFPTSNARRVIGSDAALSAAPIELSGSRARSWNGSVSLATADGPSWATAARRAALAWDPAGRALVYAGGAVVTDANQPAFGTTLRLGYEDVNANMLNGVIESIDYYPQRLPNATLQQLTTA